MRPLLALALVLLAACGGSDRADAPAGTHDAPSSNAVNGPDPLILRVPRAGGAVRVTAYPRLDSVVWRANDAAPAIQKVLGFDQDAGVISYLDGRQTPGRIDLRLGDVGRASRTKLESAASADGSAIFGIAGATVTRVTSAGTWTFKPPRAPVGIFPQRDGSVLILAERGEQSVLWKVRPPGDDISDTLELPRVARAVATAIGDQLFLALSGGVAAVRTRTMEMQPAVPLEGDVRALAATPSGDRLFVLAGDSTKLTVIDRYQGRVERSVTLPAAARQLRMDPLGRYLLVRAGGGDSVLVVAIGTAKVLGAVASEWREDLPFVAADGAVVLAQGADVALVDGETLRPSGRVAGGAADFWYPFYWTGFRPRDASLDRPATFPGGAESALAVDSAAAAQHPDSGVRQLPPGTSLDPATPSAPPPPAFLVQLAAVSSEARARSIAQGIHVGNASARVVPMQRDGQTLYRVVLGPYPSRVAADNAGRATGQPYYVFEETP